jgi:hypothetical protein
VEKQKTGFWKTHPLLKAITVLVVFFLVLDFLYWLNVPIISFALLILYYICGSAYILGGLYGIWLNRRCHLKTSFFCLTCLVAIILVSIDYFFLYITPNWKQYGYPDWEFTRSIILFAGLQILSVVGGYILSKVISYIIVKMKQDG